MFGERRATRRGGERRQVWLDVSTRSSLSACVLFTRLQSKSAGTCQDLLYAGIWLRQRCVVRVCRSTAALQRLFCVSLLPELTSDQIHSQESHNRRPGSVWTGQAELGGLYTDSRRRGELPASLQKRSFPLRILRPGWTVRTLYAAVLKSAGARNLRRKGGGLEHWLTSLALRRRLLSPRRVLGIRIQAQTPL